MSFAVNNMGLICLNFKRRIKRKPNLDLNTLGMIKPSQIGSGSTCQKFGLEQPNWVSPT